MRYNFFFVNFVFRDVPAVRPSQKFTARYYEQQFFENGLNAEMPRNRKIDKKKISRTGAVISEARKFDNQL